MNDGDDNGDDDRGRRIGPNGIIGIVVGAGVLFMILAAVNREDEQ